MEFSVNTRALPGLSDVLERRRDDLEAGRAYLAKYTNISQWGQGVLNDMRGTHEQVVQAVDSFLHRAAWERAEPYAADVTAAVRFYDHTDVAAAAHLDAAQAPAGQNDGHPAQPRPPANQQLGPDVFLEDSCGPGYPAPHDYHFDTAPITNGWDQLSEANQAREMVWRVTEGLTNLGLLDHPVDIVEEYVARLTGDWPAFRTCADVFETIAVELDLNAGWIGHDVSVLPSVWTGSAADSCAYAVDTFRTDLARAAQTIRNAAQNYRVAAEQMKELSETLITVLTLIIDECADKAIEAAIPVLGEIGEFLVMIRLISRARKIMSEINEIRKCFVSGNAVAENGLGATGKIGPLELTTVSTATVPAYASASPRVHAE